MTTTEITWGDPIDAANDGEPLPWLKADERVKCYWGYSGAYEGMETWVHCVSRWTAGFQIKLPADHPYYKAVARGFTYWPGGDSAPDDWDGGEVLFKGLGEYVPSADGWQVVIGYRKRAEPADDNDDYVRVKRMTRTDADARGLDLTTIGNLGLLIDETPLEQFERDHGKLSENQRNCIEEFIMWQDKKNHG